MGRLMKAHCDFVLSIGKIAGFCDAATDAHKNEQRKEVVKYLQEMASVAEQSWNEYVAIYDDVKNVWEISRYPKGEKGYIMNPQTNYLAGWTADLSYLILAEKKLDMPGYAEKLRKMADHYQKEGSFSAE